jgi:hypothetical protein
MLQNKVQLKQLPFCNPCVGGGGFSKLTICMWFTSSFLQIMNLKVLAEASLNGITKDMHLHRGSVHGKHGRLTKPSWDSSLPFPSKYFF